MVIYVKIINEDIDVYRPVKSVKVNNNVYKIIQENTEKDEQYGEIWEFNKNDIVKCNNQLRAFEKIQPKNGKALDKGWQ